MSLYEKHYIFIQIIFILRTRQAEGIMWTDYGLVFWRTYASPGHE